MRFTLVCAEHGFDDFDVVDLQHVHRVCVPHAIERGDTFNVYCSNGVKLGATWEGSLERSMTVFTETHAIYRNLAA